MGILEVKTQDQEQDHHPHLSENIVSLAADVPLLEKDRHIKYWLRCLRTPLPQPYTSNDANRMTLAFFTLSALDLLGVLFTRTLVAERREYVEWIYRHQHRDGGFCGFTTAAAATSPGGEDQSEDQQRRKRKNAAWNPATLSATYFALGSLSVLADDLTRVERQHCLEWLRRMQRLDGSFGDFSGPDGVIEGGMDTRFGYFAACIRWWLRVGDGGAGEFDGVGATDIDVEALVRCIAQSETYDGGVSEEPYREAHAGFTYCAIATLACLDRSDSGRQSDGKQNNVSDAKPSALSSGLSSREHTIRWLVSRLTAEIEPDDFDYPDDTSNASALSGKVQSNGNKHAPEMPSKEDDEGFKIIRSTPASLEQPRGVARESAAPLLSQESVRTRWTGFNGRANKVADTCYAFWVGGSLQILNATHLIDQTHIRSYLLEKTQHMIAGGFGKMPGDLPDIYHAYLGLAALALIDGHEDDGAALSVGMEDASCVVEGQETKGEGDTRLGDERRYVRALDPVLCVSVGARRWVEGLEWRKSGGRGGDT